MKMRKDWIRTEEEVELRRLKKLAKKQKKLTKIQQYHLSLPLVVRKKKRLMIKPTTQQLIINPVNVDNLIRLIIFHCCFRSILKHFSVLIVIYVLKIKYY